MIRKNKNGFSVIVILLIIGIFGVAAFGIYAYRFRFFEYRLAQEQRGLPKAIRKIISVSATTTNPQAMYPYQDSKAFHSTSTSINRISPVIKLPDEINIAVPFTVQAPFGIWDAIHEDGCEEAAALMLARYYQNKSIDNPEDVDREILKLVDWENHIFGFNKDTSAALTARMLSEYYGLTTVFIKYGNDVTVDSIKRELADERPVIIPNYGRVLHNPFFRQGGPTYHMMVIKGYTKDGKFIVNDPGTKRGADFIYTQDTIMHAINDWDNNKGGLSGRKAMIVIR